MPTLVLDCDVDPVGQDEHAQPLPLAYDPALQAAHGLGGGGLGGGLGDGDGGGGGGLGGGSGGGEGGQDSVIG
jgi:hypothetical protein